jgi:predicted dinucleotide-binding enzyme
MKIGVLGTGDIGRTLVRRLNTAVHGVKVANSEIPKQVPVIAYA